MSDGYKRKHESGFEKRKKKEQKDEALKKDQGCVKQIYKYKLQQRHVSDITRFFYHNPSLSTGNNPD